MIRRGIKKVEMVDAWTQTSNRGSDNEEEVKRKRKIDEHKKSVKLLRPL